MGASAPIVLYLGSPVSKLTCCSFGFISRCLNSRADLLAKEAPIHKTLYSSMFTLFLHLGWFEKLTCWKFKQIFYNYLIFLDNEILNIIFICSYIYIIVHVYIFYFVFNQLLYYSNYLHIQNKRYTLISVFSQLCLIFT